MLNESATTFFVVLVTVQLIGIATIFGARLSEQTRYHHLWQWAFLAALLLVGVTSVLAMGIAGCNGLWCAGTLATMVIGGTLDLRNMKSDHMID
jgi:hypothetical protein